MRHTIGRRGVFKGRDRFVGDRIVIEETDTRIRIDYKEWWELYREDPKRFLAHRRHDVGRQRWSYRLAAYVKDIGWITYGWEFDRKKQADYEPGFRGAPGVLYVWEPNAYKIIMDELSSLLEEDGVKIMWAGPPEDEAILP